LCSFTPDRGYKLNSKTKLKMQIFGADFSGGRDASKGIYYARANLNGQKLTLQNVVHCDDRLDLFAAIVSSNASWGLDFPFALPAESYGALGLKNWNELLELTVALNRNQFMNLLDARLENFEVCSKIKNHLCRHTDVKAKTFSPLKKYNPSLRSMIYGGFKLLAYLKRQGVSIYPFSQLSAAQAQVYEVYPSYLWAKTKMRRTLNLKQFTKSFNNLNLLELELPSNMLEAPNQDYADAVVACVIMGTCVALYNIHNHWTKQPESITNDEWNSRSLEGIILRI
jgi:hypothetical protein